uniref:Peptidase metallopeptidase domain-containing protein n=1 Tax=Echeneis naucrates TaxID=173247 RepID=A0A665UQJ8_ECHNA
MGEDHRLQAQILLPGNKHLRHLLLKSCSFSLCQDYISQFYGDIGMANKTLRSIINNTFSSDLETMQTFFGLEVTGVLDNSTITVMKAPRCGVSDISQYGHFFGKPRWKKRLITYRITQYTRDLSRNQVDATIAQAFQLYSDVIPLEFKQIYSGTADIMILFKGGSHGDFYPFDGAGGVLAHANSPGAQEGGDTHFDDDETWTLTQRGVNLLLVAAHEFGHALGLDHSRDRRALMYPTYQYVNTNGYRLPDDDRQGVQALYGRKKELPEDPTEAPNPRDERCSRGLVFDAATSIRGDLFFFKNGYYWRKSQAFREIRFTKVNSKWPGINYVDAAFEVPNRDVVYLFEGNFQRAGYPKSLTNLGLPSSVNKVDAAVYVPTTRKTLIFSSSNLCFVINMEMACYCFMTTITVISIGHKYIYDESRNQMDPGYPRYITWDFPGIGSKVDAAFENHGYFYFSNGPRQTEFYMQYKRVMRVLLNYGWLNCY